MRKDQVLRLITFCCLLVANAAYAAPDKMQPTITTPNVQQRAIPPGAIKAPIVPVAMCPDPAIVDFLIRANGRNTDGTYIFDIAAAVKNVGNAKYDSRGNQQMVSFYRGTGPSVFTSSSIDLAQIEPGQQKYSGYYRISNWNPTPGEFGENISAILSYDPDILIDGNTKNDDCNNRNNRKALSVAEVNRLLHIPGF